MEYIQTMNVELKRIADNKKATIGSLFINGHFACFTVEDEHRDSKVFGETRIPEGTYSIGVRNAGAMNEKYKKRFSYHKGMLCIHNKNEWVLENDGKRFQYIYLHCGNKESETFGCPLVNMKIDGNTFEGSDSEKAYELSYNIIIEALELGIDVKIIIS